MKGYDIKTFDKKLNKLLKTINIMKKDCHHK